MIEPSRLKMEVIFFHCMRFTRDFENIRISLFQKNGSYFSMFKRMWNPVMKSDITHFYIAL